MKKDELEVGMRVQRTNYSCGPTLKVNRKWTHGKVLEDSVYESNGYRGMEKVKVEFDNQQVMMVPINQLEEETY